MRKQYLHLSAYVCLNCAGPAIAGSLAVRENEISQETEIKQIGEICLACGQRPNLDTDLHCIRARLHRSNGAWRIRERITTQRRRQQSWLESRETSVRAPRSQCEL